MTISVNCALSCSDPYYSELSPTTFPLVLMDDEYVGIAFDKKNVNDWAVEGQTSTFNVHLGSAPLTGSVTLTPSANLGSQTIGAQGQVVAPPTITFEPASVSFDAASYDVPVQISFLTVEDNTILQFGGTIDFAVAATDNQVRLLLKTTIFRGAYEISSAEY